MDSPKQARRSYAPPLAARARIGRGRAGRLELEEDHVAVEAPLEIRIGGAPWLVVMRTPGHDAELAVGLALAEEVLGPARELRELVACGDEDNVVDLDVADADGARIAAGRSVVVQSSCGICGRQTIERLQATAPPFAARPALDLARAAQLADEMAKEQAGFRATGGLHAAAIFDAGGARIVSFEDVGRHNAVDKCVGALYLADLLPVDAAMLVVSGRVSFEIVQKALIARVPTVVAVSAPSSLAIDLARASNMTLLGFARGGGFNLYAGADLER